MFRRTPIVVALALVLAAFAAACSSGGKSTKTPSALPSPTAVPTAAAVAARPSPGCSQATPPAGESEQTLTVGADTGTYRQMVPSAAAEKKPLPLIIDLHGVGSTAADQAAITEFETLGEQQGVFVLTPSGQGPGRDGNGIDFLTQLLDASEQRLCIDTARVFMDGFSLGGLSASTVGCQLADRIAAIGLVSFVPFLAACHPSRPLPVMVFFGKLDMFYSGGGPGYNIDHEGRFITSPVAAPPVETVVAQWAADDGCQITPQTTQVSQHVERRTFGGCSGGSAVEFYVISDGNHAWAGADLETFNRVYTSARAAGIQPTQEIKATPLLWDFWMRHPLAP